MVLIFEMLQYIRQHKFFEMSTLYSNIVLAIQLFQVVMLLRCVFLWNVNDCNFGLIMFRYVLLDFIFGNAMLFDVYYWAHHVLLCEVIFLIRYVLRDFIFVTLPNLNFWVVTYMA